MDTKKNCGLCSEHGRVWIDGYHGNQNLDFTTNQGLLAQIAGLDSLDINLSQCCVPSLKFNIEEVYTIVETTPLTNTIPLTNNIAAPGKVTSTSTPATNTITFKSNDDLVGNTGTFTNPNFGNYFTIAVPSAFGLDDILITQALTATSAGSDNPPYTVTNVITATDLSTGVTRSNTISSTFGSRLDPIDGKVSTDFAKFSLKAGSTGSFLLGRYTISITQFPLFQFEATAATTDDEFTLTMLSPLQISISEDHLLDFISCQDDCMA